MEETRKNRACSAFPCHDGLEDCTFCYCPKYPCNDTNLGYYLENGYWNCENCNWPHKKDRVDKLYKFLKEHWKDDEFNR